MGVDFAELFRVDVAPLELVVRGSAMYWFLFLLFRFVLQRDTGSIAIADVLLLVLIADAATNAMAGSYDSITEGFILVGTIAGWNLAIDWANFRFPRLRRLLEAPPRPLVRDGRMLRANMKRELLTTEDLMGKLREQGIEKLAEVKLATMESDGEISVLRVPGTLPGGEAQKPQSGNRAALK